MSDDGPLATIIVRAYNQQAIVADAIQSCFDQTYSPLEIILSDDCSEDGTWNVIDRMATNYVGPHTVITNRNTTNLGIVGHTNKTMQSASGTLILSCAGDDIAFPDKTARLVEAWREDPDRIKAVSSAVIVMSREGTDIGIKSALTQKRIKAEPSAMDVIKRRAWCTGAATMWHRDVIDKFGPISSQDYAEDHQLLLRASLLGCTKYVDQPLLRYRLGGVSNPVQKKTVDNFFEHRLKRCEIGIGRLLGFQENLAKLEVPAQPKLRKAIQQSLDEFGFELELTGLSIGARRARLPIAFYRSARRASLIYIKLALAYSFPNTYLSHRRRRYGKR